jgi:Mg/Co/Ni transporter MgtE
MIAITTIIRKLPAPTVSNKFMNKKYIGIGASLGLCFGIVAGTAMHNISLGIALGLPFGTAFGAVWARKKSID